MPDYNDGNDDRGSKLRSRSGGRRRGACNPNRRISTDSEGYLRLSETEGGAVSGAGDFFVRRSIPSCRKTLPALSFKYSFHLASQPFPFLAVVAVAFDDAKENVAIALFCA